MAYKIPVYQPSIEGNEKEYVNQCLDSTWISSKGEFVERFESKFADYIGVNYATSVCNGTVALHLALVALGVGEGDEVIVPTFTYIASVSTIVFAGAVPVFVDSLEDSWQMDPADVKRKLTGKTKAIMMPHIYGHPCDMDEIMAMAKERNIFVVEDCAEAFGTKYKGNFAGTFGDISTFSFYGNKTITTGEGGMLITNDETLYDRSYHLKMHGLAKYRQYWHDVLGFNYRMTNICAAIGLAQLEQADEKIKAKRRVAELYKKHLNGIPVHFHGEYGNVYHSYWMCSILFESPQLREDARAFLSESGVETRPTFYPVHTMPMFSNKYQRLPVAEKLGWRGINLPSWPGLSESNIEEITGLLKTFFTLKGI